MDPCTAVAVHPVHALQNSQRRTGHVLGALMTLLVLPGECGCRETVQMWTESAKAGSSIMQQSKSGIQGCVGCVPSVRLVAIKLVLKIFERKRDSGEGFGSEI
jgi:hypothetical protein